MGAQPKVISDECLRRVKLVLAMDVADLTVKLSNGQLNVPQERAAELRAALERLREAGVALRRNTVARLLNDVVALSGPMPELIPLAKDLVMTLQSCGVIL